MKKILNLIFRLEILVFLIGVILNPQKSLKYFGLEKIIQSRLASAQDIECLLPDCFPIKIPTIPCFPPCIPTCPPKPTPTEIIPTQSPQAPTPTPEEEIPTLTPTLPGQPSPTFTPSVGGGEVGGPPAGGEGGGPPGPPHCGSQTPSVPHLKSVNTIKTGEVELFWDPVEPVTHYNISYGPSAGNYLYGVANTGKVTSFRVGALGEGNYCFVVRAVNDCAPSNPSNELCTGGVGGQVLGVKVLGMTGRVNCFVWQTLFIMGVICGCLGVRICLVKQRKVFS